MIFFSNFNQFINIFRDFKTDVHDPVEKIYLELKSTHIELYTIKLEIMAQFSGLRHFLNNFPVTSSVIGIVFVISVIAFIFIMPIFRYFV